MSFYRRAAVSIASLVLIAIAGSLSTENTAASSNVLSSDPRNIHAAAIPPSTSLEVARLETAPQSVTIWAGENDRYYFWPNELDLRTGDIELRFINQGLRPHTFNVKTQDWATLFNFGQVQPGEEASLAFRLEEPGMYVFYCVLYKHVDLGQTGWLTVTQ